MARKRSHAERGTNLGTTPPSPGWQHPAVGRVPSAETECARSVATIRRPLRPPRLVMRTIQSPRPHEKHTTLRTHTSTSALDDWDETRRDHHLQVSSKCQPAIKSRHKHEQTLKANKPLLTSDCVFRRLNILATDPREPSETALSNLGIVALHLSLPHLQRLVHCIHLHQQAFFPVFRLPSSQHSMSLHVNCRSFHRET